MAKRNRDTTPSSVERRLSEGRGSGQGASYKPWLLIQDVPSTGLASRILGWKTGREHHLLSNLETSYFYILEWSEVVVDIREQYPLLPLTETLEIAERCGYRHPTDPKTREPVVMTTDFLITVQHGAGTELNARTLKLSQNLNGDGKNRRQKDVRPVDPLTSQRTLEKLEIERLYWRNRKVSWAIVTDLEIPGTFAKNVHWLHPYRDLAHYPHLSIDLVQRVARILTPTVQSKSDTGLSSLTAQCDEQLGLEAGVSLMVARYLIANRIWLVNMNELIVPSKPLALLGEFTETTLTLSRKNGTARQYVA